MKDFTKISLGDSNCFLLPVDDGYLMIDCGRSGEEYVLQSKLNKLGVRIPSIKYLLITHHHDNHCGLLEFLLSQNDSIQVILSQSCARYLETRKQVAQEDHVTILSHPGTFPHFHKPKIKQLKNFPAYQIRSTDILLDKDDIFLLPIKGKDLLVLSTPGHTDDSISLIYKTEAFVGDAASSMFETIGIPQDLNVPYNMADCYESWRKLLSLGIQNIHPSHGNSFPANQLENLLITNFLTNG